MRYEEIAQRMRKNLQSIYEDVQKRIPVLESDPYIVALNELYESMEMRGIWKQLGTEGLQKLVDKGFLTKQDVFLMPMADTVFYDQNDEEKTKRASEFWWESVDEVWQGGKGKDIWVMVTGGKQGPNYEAVYKRWKDKVEAFAGYRPTRSKEQSMAQMITNKSIEAVKKMGNIVQHIDPESLGLPG